MTNALIHPEPVGNFSAPPSTPKIYENLHVIDAIDFDKVDRVLVQLGVDVNVLARIFEEDETESSQM